MNELQIVAPEGYEVDKEKSTFEKIVFKKKSGKPMSWEEFCKKRPRVNNEYYIDTMSKVTNFNTDRSTLTTARRIEEDCNLCKTKEEAEAFLALIQLRRLWWEWNDGLQAKSSKCDIDYDYSNKRWRASYMFRSSFPFWFKDEETAELFLETFKDLFDKVKVLYE